MSSGYNQFSSKPSANGAEWGDLQDPMAQLAARIGQLRGSMEFNRGNPSSGPYHQAALEAELNPLLELMNRLQSKQDLDQKLMERQLQSQENGRRHHGGSVMGGVSGQGYGPNGQGQYLMDPYRKIRETAIEEATKFLKTQNPFADSSPSPKK